MRRALLPVIASLAGLFGGCIQVKVKMDPVEVNANINVNVRIDKALDDFFGDLDKKSSTIATPAPGPAAPATAP